MFMMDAAVNPNAASVKDGGADRPEDGITDASQMYKEWMLRTLRFLSTT